MKIKISIIVGLLCLLTNLSASNLFVISKNNQWGYMDESGTIVIPPQYLAAGIFTNGFACVLNAQQEYCYINEVGKVVIKNKDFIGIAPFSNGCAVIVKQIDYEPKYGYIDTQGKEVIPCSYQEAFPFSNDMAVVKIKGKKGVIDKSQHFILQPQYHDINPIFSECRIIARETENSAWQCFDNNGKLLFYIPQADFVSSFSEGMAIVIKNKKYGFINIKGTKVIKCSYNYAWCFTEGLAAVITDTGCGYINKTGKVIIPPTFENAMPFSDGLACVKVNGLWGYIDSSGTWCIKPKYSEASNFHNGLAYVVDEQNNGYYITKNDIKIMAK